MRLFTYQAFQCWLLFQHECFILLVKNRRNNPFKKFQPIVLLQWPCCLCSMFMVLMCLNFATRWSMLSTIINLINIGYKKEYYITLYKLDFLDFLLNYFELIKIQLFNVSQFSKFIFYSVQLLYEF